MRKASCPRTAIPANAPAVIFAASEKFGGRASYLDCVLARTMLLEQRSSIDRTHSPRAPSQGHAQPSGRAVRPARIVVFLIAYVPEGWKGRMVSCELEVVADRWQNVPRATQREVGMAVGEGWRRTKGSLKLRWPEVAKGCTSFRSERTV